MTPSKQVEPPADVRASLPITDWLARNSDRSNPEAFINTHPAYFASECADAIQIALSATPAPVNVEQIRREAFEEAARVADYLAQCDRDYGFSNLARRLDEAATAIRALDTPEALRRGGR